MVLSLQMSIIKLILVDELFPYKNHLSLAFSSICLFFINRISPLNQCCMEEQQKKTEILQHFMSLGNFFFVFYFIIYRVNKREGGDGGRYSK